MWFGDLVTMRWWDDLWLNESFANWAGFGVAASATRFTQAWTTFALSQKAWAYVQDQLPSTHPVVADIPGLEGMFQNFDGITYAKGASVLKQLVAFVGYDAFLAGVNRYFERHAWGNATLADLLVELEASSGRDLGAWARVWLQEPGVTTLQAHVELDAEGRYASVRIEQLPATRPVGVSQVLRPHRVAIGVYRWAELDGRRRLVRDARVEVDVLGADVGRPRAGRRSGGRPPAGQRRRPDLRQGAPGPGEHGDGAGRCRRPGRVPAPGAGLGRAVGAGARPGDAGPGVHRRRADRAGSRGPAGDHRHRPRSDAPGQRPVRGPGAACRRGAAHVRGGPRRCSTLPSRAPTGSSPWPGCTSSRPPSRSGWRGSATCSRAESEIPGPRRSRTICAGLR